MGKDNTWMWVIGIGAVAGLGWCFLMGPCQGILGGQEAQAKKSPKHTVKVKKDKTPPFVPTPNANLSPAAIDIATGSVPNGLGGTTPISQIPFRPNAPRQVTLSPDALRLAGARANLSYY